MSEPKQPDPLGAAPSEPGILDAKQAPLSPSEARARDYPTCELRRSFWDQAAPWIMGAAFFAYLAWSLTPAHGLEGYEPCTRRSLEALRDHGVRVSKGDAALMSGRCAMGASNPPYNGMKPEKKDLKVPPGAKAS